jgi:HlyD family type I secretion membrane fusion protein
MTASLKIAPTPTAGLTRMQAEAGRLGRQAGLVTALALVPLGAWLALAPLMSAVVASGFVKVDLDRRPVQHSEGGLVREVLVRDGQRVAQGAALVILGDMGVDADLNRLNYRVLAERAGQTRLEAEQAGSATLVFAPELVQAAMQDTRLAEQFDKEKALFAARRDGVGSQIRLLRQQQEKIHQEAASLGTQIVQAAESLRLQLAELETQRGMVREGFVSQSRVSQMEATVADYRVRVEEKRAELVRAEQRVVDSDLRIRTIQGEYHQQASDMLKTSGARLAEVMQDQRKASDNARRQVITAPVAGEVINLRFNSPGAVVAPREPVAEIVPLAPRLLVEARLRPDDINRVQAGMPADIRFTAYSHRTTKLVEGRVVYVSPDRLVDRARDEPYYQALIEADPASLAEAGAVKLLAGMPAEVFVRGERRTALQYLLEPVLDLTRRAARER